MDIVSKSYALPAHAIHHAAQTIKTDGWIFIAGDDLKQDLALEEDSLSSFSRFWDSLSRDEFMADNGTYRYRRYSQFELCDPQGELMLLPHTAYSQPKNINTLNGGIDRVYPPLEEGFIAHPLFTSLLRELGNIFNQAEGERLDVIVADDHRVMHEVSPILCSKGSQGYRDVLVIAWERVK